MLNFYEEIGFKLLQRYVNEDSFFSSDKLQILIQVISATFDNNNEMPEMLSIVDCLHNPDSTKHVAEMVFNDISNFSNYLNLSDMERYEYHSTFTAEPKIPSKIIFIKSED